MPRSLPNEPLVCWHELLSTAGTLSDNRSMQEPITRDPELMHGTPVFRGHSCAGEDDVRILREWRFSR